MKADKRISLFFLLMLVCLMLAGCRKNVQDAQTGSAVQSATPQEIESEMVQADAGLAAEEPEEMDWSLIDQEVLKDKDITNILVVGQDRRKGDSKSVRTRSDTMIICSINNKTGQISLTSLMRDMYVPIPGYNANRINSAYVFGGMELLDQVILEDFGVVIDGNVEVDFEGFLNAITILAPLDIELTEAEAEYMNTTPLDGTQDAEYRLGALTEGKNSLLAGELLEYARMRYVGNSDWDRTARQRNLMKVAYEKARSSNIITLIKLASKVIPSINTDMSSRQLLGCVYTVITRNMTLREETMRLPVDGCYSSRSIQGMSVLVPDLQANAYTLQEFIYGEVLNYNIRYFTEYELTDESMEENIEDFDDEEEETEEEEPEEEVAAESETAETEPTPVPVTEEPTPEVSPVETQPTDTPEPTPAATASSSEDDEDEEDEENIDDPEYGGDEVISGSTGEDWGYTGTSSLSSADYTYTNSLSNAG